MKYRKTQRIEQQSDPERISYTHTIEIVVEISDGETFDDLKKEVEKKSSLKRLAIAAGTAASIYGAIVASL